MSDVRVVLRYFPVRGRAQALRHSLADAGIDFDDLRVPLADWPERRKDAAFSGLFRALPTLTWGDVAVSEVLAIAAFIARRLGQHQGLGEDAITFREAICSSTYIDVTHRLADVIRADLNFPGTDPGQALAMSSPPVLRKMELLDRQLPATPWIGGDSPVVADFFAAEAFEVLRYVLGPDRGPALHGRLPRLAALAQAVRERPQLTSAWNDRPTRFTGRPDEDRVVAQLRVVDLSSVGL